MSTRRNERSAEVKGASAQSVQDANLIKVDVGFCYELTVPLVDRLIARMIATAPISGQPENFGPPRAGSFAGAVSQRGRPRARRDPTFRSMHRV